MSIEKITFVPPLEGSPYIKTKEPDLIFYQQENTENHRRMTADLPKVQPFLENERTFFEYVFESDKFNGDTPCGVRTINEHLKDQQHPKTGVPYLESSIKLPDGSIDKVVCPEFEATIEITLDPNENLDYQGTRAKHEKEANKKLKELLEKNPEEKDKFTPEQLEQIANGDTPDGYTWHHHQEAGKMQLVDSKTHRDTPHTGGYAIWGKQKEQQS